MPKRCNPFGDNLSPQLKIHVREKEVNRGVNHQTQMQSVYDRTQELLFAGMKEMRDRHLPLDVNENCLPRIEVDKAEKLDRKQMHLNKSCQLVDSPALMDMDTDSNSCQDSMLQHPLTHNLETSITDAVGAHAPESCSLVLPSFGKSFVRSPAEYSPMCVHSPVSSSSSSSPLCLGPVRGASALSTSNAFSFMKQANLQKDPVIEASVIHNACPNCRQSVKAQDVARCQFCEKSVCCACLRQCAGCLLCFCQLCSVV
ncbi:unnamed protein product, partial [Candidula unifasciata]